ncbi:MAG: RecX family transcriptional regulator, partial [Massilioclostridium sp.]|nr:RecX family transcriptional regulator [Massilioclostridium sp.]
RKGIERELAERVLDEAEVDPADQLGELIAKKYARYLGDEKGRKKVISALLRLGHNYEDVKRALQQYEEFEENEQWL